MFIPKSLDRSVTDAARMLYSDAWLEAEDDAPLPTSTTPKGSYPWFLRLAE